uniref:Beta-defensin-like domain-containing protein n=1 Tax=Pelusios castaneus TaxID=367368 RepID=A0A8C8RTE5_9SAUR
LSLGQFLIMIYLFLFFVVVSNADFLDNITCRRNFGFCHSGACPFLTTRIGTCINGKINCCKRPRAR